MYKVTVHRYGSYKSNINGNDKKKVYVGPTQGHFEKEIATIEVVLHMKYIDTEPVYLHGITKVSTPLIFLQIFKYICSWDNTDKMTL